MFINILRLFKHKLINMLFSIYIILIIFMKNTNGNGFGRCPKYPSMPRFNMTRVLGKWYEVERSFYLPEIAAGCTTLVFQPEKDGFDYESRLFRLQVSIKTINRITGNPSYNLGYAKPVSIKSSIMDFNINSRLPAVFARLLPGSGRYQVLYTDYKKFAILWSCAGFGPIGYTDQIWILGRDHDFKADIRHKIYDSLKKLGLDSDRLIISKNMNCS